MHMKFSEAPVPSQHFGYMRLNEVLQIGSFSRATAYRLRQEGKFIPAIKIGSRITVYSRAAVYAWFQEREGQQ
jgi:predicted DNA-binding transcriptional regulator AlpA